MKQFYSFSLFFLMINLNAQIINIPDLNFKNKLLSSNPTNYIVFNSNGYPISIDANGNNEIEVSEALLVGEINVSNSAIQSLDGISNFENLKSLLCANNSITSLDLTANVALNVLNCNYNQINSILINQPSNIRSFEARNNALTTFDYSFFLINRIDIQYNQITTISLDIQNYIAEGIIGFYCNNNQLSSINVSALLPIFIQEFNCSYNNLTSLDAESFDVSELFNFNCSHNQLTSLGVLNFVGGDFDCSYNQLTELIFPNTCLWKVRCNNNLLTNFSLPPVTTNNCISMLSLSDNLLTSIDLSSIGSGIVEVFCYNNPNLTNLNLKNGIGTTYLLITDNLFLYNLPNLEYVCANENEVTLVQEYLLERGFTTSVVNSYCSFVPGGVFYTINGNSRVDLNDNGCDSNDTVVQNLKLNITNGTASTTIIPNATGNYSIPVQQDSHTITPVFEIPSYFTVSPASITVSFPAQTSPFVQNFCASFNGSHPDLEVIVIPLTIQRPGFDALYKITYKNKGTVALTGSVNFQYQNDFQEFVSSIPGVSSQNTTTLSWDFVSLAPFESKEIYVTFNLNAPTDNPPLESGSILNYTASIIGNLEDETPSDNTFVFNQEVVNSFDPNDKRCLEGNTIPLNKVGDYVHYMIRFENTGTANAQNVVVVDNLDVSKFDVSSFQALNSSHPFVTKISNSNKVEFIFENINLPFDDASNDGYIVFKIKTKNNLQLNDTFSNTASIYFDYNFPIVTEPAITVVSQALGLVEVDGVFVSIVPNPTQDVLTITTKNEISSVMIFDTNGRIIQTKIQNNELETQLDLTSYQQGVYYVKVITKEGFGIKKIVKNNK
ncbi:DUF7619 domain-containing protein [Flavobacterium dankookense]|uniref:Putative repeat protein (TIGR01451 family)/predicted secreted protein (Por secretion system target) n=1 Tax=Flavobacterium dankookense TaxID=706186 RepID=A0A4R6Q9C1_9FLAO|nr:T9SS type A sorting domain-containing protein [Flavobacterium dankookense]TDP59188.1 putative repeat protein (TIGR01451 family)/predicted secreted protein (Por secretion system target) [Flavobacterium dankookense]